MIEVFGIFFLEMFSSCWHPGSWGYAQNFQFFHNKM